jgi:hypothetical protein
MNQDWAALMAAKAISARQQMTRQHLAQAAYAGLAQMKALAEEALQRLVVEAQKEADDFWAENQYQRAQGSKEEQGKFGTRVRLINHSLQATWYRNRFIRKKPYSVHIRKGRQTMRYPESAFAQANAWEKILIKLIEDRYALLRQRSAVLSRLRALLAEYERLLRESFARDAENR